MFHTPGFLIGRALPLCHADGICPLYGEMPAIYPVFTQKHPIPHFKNEPGFILKRVSSFLKRTWFLFVAAWFCFESNEFVLETGAFGFKSKQVFRGMNRLTKKTNGCCFG